jgi:hypothetical protein
LDSRAACHLASRYVRYLASYAVPGDHICPCSHIKSSQGALSQHAFMHSIEMNATY